MQSTTHSQALAKWQALAENIIDDVAQELMRDRPIFYETETEIRFGNRGSFSVNKQTGTFYDYETSTGGGLLDMIIHLDHAEDKDQAKDWLRDKGFLDGSFSPTQHHRPQAQNRTPSTRNMFKVGLKLWQEAEPVPFYQHHPVRQWCRHRNLFPSYKEIPAIIRWHEKKHFIIVALAPIEDFINAYPEPPAPRQFHLISITVDGKKSYAFNRDDKRTYGQSEHCCVALFGNPLTGEIATCEGIADALSLTSDFPCVIASITTFNKIANDEKLVEYLSTKESYLCGDNDAASNQAEAKLANAIGKQGGEVFFIEDKTAKDPAEAAQQYGGER